MTDGSREGHLRELFRGCMVAALCVGLAACGGEGEEASAPPAETQEAATDKVVSATAPEANRFLKEPIVQGLNEPVSFNFLPDSSVLITERRGRLIHVNVAAKEMTVLATLDVDSREEFGLLAVAAAPDFETSRHIYLMYDALEGELIMQRVSRFTWEQEGFNLASEKIILSFPMDTTCCHTGGAIKFDKDGLLYIAVGDNTNPFASDGFAPTDSRADRTYFDARRSSGNTNDLRGGILRIRPEADGTYSIPEGNLFPGGEGGRPEIYTMGARNPYTLAIDPATNDVYYGDIGPDAREDNPNRGPRGHDEFNRVTKAGNFGWPYHIAENKPYNAYNWETQVTGKPFDPQAPFNDSPRNTGARVLPPAQPALIAYPYNVSDKYPELGAGGRNALAAGVYRAPGIEGKEGDYPYPAYYEGKFFISDFIRGWMKAVTMDEAGGVTKIEDFAPHIALAGVLDIGFGPDGALYVLEYGRDWFAPNPESGLSRIRFVGDGNRPPIAGLSLSATDGAAPLTVTASAAESSDLDGDELSYEWKVQRLVSGDEGPDDAAFETAATGEDASLTFEEPGRYLVRLVVTDPSGASASADQFVDVGNTPPELTIAIEGNSSFFWSEPRALTYSVSVTDEEDGSTSEGTISAEAVNVGIVFESAAMGHQQDLARKGEELVEANGCLACHQVDEASIGPAYVEVARKYAGRADVKDYLTAKIRSGGAGAWGEVPMPPYDHLSEEDVEAIVAFVLSSDKGGASLPASGTVTLDEHMGAIGDAGPAGQRVEGAYRISATYTDKGAGEAPPITRTLTHDLVPARIFLGEVWSGRDLPEGISGRVSEGLRVLRFMDDDTADAPDATRIVVPLGEIDLTDIRELTVGNFPMGGEGAWEVAIHKDAPDGPVLGSFSVPVGAGLPNSYRSDTIAISEEAGRHKLFVKAGIPQGNGRWHLADIAFGK